MVRMRQTFPVADEQDDAVPIQMSFGQLAERVPTLRYRNSDETTVLEGNRKRKSNGERMKNGEDAEKEEKKGESVKREEAVEKDEEEGESVKKEENAEKKEKEGKSVKKEDGAEKEENKHKESADVDDECERKQSPGPKVKRRRCCICGKQTDKHTLISSVNMAHTIDEIMGTTIAHLWKWPGDRHFACITHRLEFEKRTVQLYGKKHSIDKMNNLRMKGTLRRVQEVQALATPISKSEQAPPTLKWQEHNGNLLFEEKELKGDEHGEVGEIVEKDDSQSRIIETSTTARVLLSKESKEHEQREKKRMCRVCDICGLKATKWMCYNSREMVETIDFVMGSNFSELLKWQRRVTLCESDINRFEAKTEELLGRRMTIAQMNCLRQFGVTTKRQLFCLLGIESVRAPPTPGFDTKRVKLEEKEEESKEGVCGMDEGSDGSVVKRPIQKKPCKTKRKCDVCGISTNPFTFCSMSTVSTIDSILGTNLVSQLMGRGTVSICPIHNEEFEEETRRRLGIRRTIQEMNKLTKMGILQGSNRLTMERHQAPLQDVDDIKRELPDCEAQDFGLSIDIKEASVFDDNDMINVEELIGQKAVQEDIQHGVVETEDFGIPIDTKTVKSLDDSDIVKVGDLIGQQYMPTVTHTQSLSTVIHTQERWESFYGKPCCVCGTTCEDFAVVRTHSTKLKLNEYFGGKLLRNGSTVFVCREHWHEFLFWDELKEEVRNMK